MVICQQFTLPYHRRPSALQQAGPHYWRCLTFSPFCPNPNPSPIHSCLHPTIAGRAPRSRWRLASGAADSLPCPTLTPLPPCLLPPTVTNPPPPSQAERLAAGGASLLALPTPALAATITASAARCGALSTRVADQLVGLALSAEHNQIQLLQLHIWRCLTCGLDALAGEDTAGCSSGGGTGGGATAATARATGATPRATAGRGGAAGRGAAAGGAPPLWRLLMSDWVALQVSTGGGWGKERGGRGIGGGRAGAPPLWRLHMADCVPPQVGKGVAGAGRGEHVPL